MLGQGPSPAGARVPGAGGGTFPYVFSFSAGKTYQHPELEIVRDAINSRHTGGTIN